MRQIILCVTVAIMLVFCGSHTWAFDPKIEVDEDEYYGNYSTSDNKAHNTSEVEEIKRQLGRIQNEKDRRDGKIYYNEKFGRHCRDVGALGFYLIFDCD